MHRRRVRSALLKAAYDRTIGARVIGRATCVIATSQLEASELAADGVTPNLIELRANGIDVDELLPLPSRGGFRAAT